MKKILISIDDGPTCEKVASNGLELAQQLNADIALISVVDTTLLMTEGGVTPGELADIIERDYKKNHLKIIEKVYKGRNVISFVEKGKPFELILKIADEWGADMIVMGTHGRSGLAHLIMGSVAEKVIEHSKKPIFVIPTRS